MATNDGYAPYPIGLTASQTVAAILKSHNLDLGAYVTYFESTTKPTGAKMGDIWNNTSSKKMYRAYVEGSSTIWIEV